MLSDEQMRKIWPFSLLNDEQMSNKVEVKHQPDQLAMDLYENPLRIHGFSTVSEASRKNTVLGQSLVVPYTLSPFELIVEF